MLVFFGFFFGAVGDVLVGACMEDLFPLKIGGATVKYGPIAIFGIFYIWFIVIFILRKIGKNTKSRTSSPFTKIFRLDALGESLSLFPLNLPFLDTIIHGPNLALMNSDSIVGAVSSPFLASMPMVYCASSLVFSLVFLLG